MHNKMDSYQEIYVSHHLKDKTWVRQVMCRVLKNKFGIRLVNRKQMLGDSAMDCLKKAMEQSETFVFLIDSDYMRDKECMHNMDMLLEMVMKNVVVMINSLLLGYFSAALANKVAQLEKKSHYFTLLLWKTKSVQTVDRLGMTLLDLNKKTK